MSGRKQFLIEGFGGNFGFQVSYDFQEALNLGIEQALDNNAIIQLREEGCDEPCIAIVQSKFGCDIYKLIPVTEDELEIIFMNDEKSQSTHEVTDVSNTPSRK